MTVKKEEELNGATAECRNGGIAVTVDGTSILTAQKNSNLTVTDTGNRFTIIGPLTVKRIQTKRLRLTAKIVLI